MHIIGEKLNSSIPHVRQAIESYDTGAIQGIATAQAAAGAHWLDLNAGMLLEGETGALLWMMKTVRAVTDLPFVLDSPSVAVLEAALTEYTGARPLINSISLETEKLEPVLDIIQKYKTGVIALCMGDDGIPEDAATRQANAATLVEKLTSAGIPEADIYLDPLVQPVAMGDRLVIDTLTAMRKIRERFPAVHITCGLSNVSYGLPKRRLINRTFLTAAIFCGMDCAILDPLDSKLMAALRTSQMLLGQDEYCGGYLEAFENGLLDD